MPSEPPAALLDLIYDAAADVSLWPTAIAGIADLCGGAGGVLFGHSVRRGVVLFEHNGRMDDRCNDAYKARHVVNDWSLHMAARPPGQTVLSDQVLPLERLRRTAFYDEVLRPQALARNAMTTLARRGTFQASFDLVRTERQGPFERWQLVLLRQVIPHLARSLRLAHRVEGYRALQLGQQAALEHLACGVVLLDRKTRVLYANPAARTLLCSGRGLALRGGAIACTDAGPHRRLEAALKSVLGGLPAATLHLAGAADARLTLTLSSVRGRDGERLRSLAPASAETALMLFITTPAAATGIAGEHVRIAFGLTAAEARVALAALGAGTVGDLAQLLQVSPNTVKTHLSRVFAKLGVARRTELVKLLQPMAQLRPTGEPSLQAATMGAGSQSARAGSSGSSPKVAM